MMSFLLKVTIILSVTCTAQQLYDSPEQYFGGNNHSSYIDWVREASILENYTASTFVPVNGDPHQGVALHWKITSSHIHVAVAARVSDESTGGWLALGISPAGGMLGADVVYWQASQPDTLTDAHILEDRATPLTDSCGQDWTLVQADSSWSGFIMWEGKRLLRTQDSHDHDIVVDTSPGIPDHRVIAAWGDGDNIEYHGNRVARGAVRFATTATPDFATEMKQKASSSFVVQATNHTIRPVDTDYVNFCISKTDVVRQGVPGDAPLHIVGFEPILTPGNEKYVHHFVVTASSDEGENACAQPRSFVEVVYGMSAYIEVPYCAKCFHFVSSLTRLSGFLDKN
jgi:hypothetical protein